LKVGVNLISFGPGASPESLSRWAAFAENVGYHFVMLGDHVAITPDVQGRYPAPFYDPFTTLGWLAGMTRRVELGFTVIVLPYRHPLETARMAANLDRLSGGRLIFGVGVGWARQEFEVLGLPFASWTLDRLAAYLHETKGIAMQRSRIGEILRREGLRWRQQETWFGERPDPAFAAKRGPLSPSIPPRQRTAS
jgi:alkanesulfonate monooxygenase SsuD/methylene tetrahydromethanopterin reductase-like flavin-dependent oxidoreductase (luciferase family)